jgi:hypothetical protein
LTKLAPGSEELAVFVVKIFLVALFLLLIADFLSTFLYHVPEHVFGKFHTIVHHGSNRSFVRYALLTKNPLVLLNGFLGVLPYFLFIPWFWHISPLGTLLGLVVGEFHVLWRHLSTNEWQTPKPLLHLCNYLFITTPERHWLHHQDADLAYGDIFTFYDRPARAWLSFLWSIKRQYRESTKTFKA